MMINWNEYMSPDLLRGYRTISEAGNKTGKLDAKTRELIALAVAVIVRCDGCIATQALGVAINVNAGAAPQPRPLC